MLEMIAQERCRAHYLSQRALHSAQEVGVLQAIVVAVVNVIQLKAQALHLFKIKVQCEDFGVGWVGAAAHHLRAVHLQARKRL